MPPMSPTSTSMNNFHSQRQNNLSESQIFEDKNFATNRVYLF